MNREEIINSYSKNDFAYCLENDTKGIILKIIDDEGIKILNKSKLKNERIAYILTYSKYSNELLSKIDFIDLFLNSDISFFYACLSNLKIETYNNIIKRCLEVDEYYYNIPQLLLYFSKEYQIYFLDNFNIPLDMVYDILNKSSDSKIINKILSKYNVDLSNDKINLHYFFAKMKELSINNLHSYYNKQKDVEPINIPSYMINTKMADKLCKTKNIFEIRTIINNANYCIDTTLINEYVKSFEEFNVNNSSEKTFVEPINTIYNKIIEYISLKNQIKESDTDELWIKYKAAERIINDIIKSEFKDIILLNDFNNIEFILDLLKQINNKMISNYIIDYHFEENYHNIILDMNELLHFYYDGNIVLPEERVELYNEILNIDYLSIEDKKNLYYKLKQLNIKEIFYDDMSTARYIVNEAIKECSLSSQTIEQYKNEELSKKYGVNVYTMNGDSFFGIVKTGRGIREKLPTGFSYSLIGDGGLAVFGNIKDSKTFLYDSDTLNPQQIVHVFPYDSFTLYKPFSGIENASNRVNSLALPDELVTVSPGYNELLILEKGTMVTDIDEHLHELKPIALYCLDEIRTQDVETAKSNNTGIFLVNSNKYIKQENKELYKYRINIDEWKCNYFNGEYEQATFEQRRK